MGSGGEGGNRIRKKKMQTIERNASHLVRVGKAAAIGPPA